MSKLSLIINPDLEFNSNFLTHQHRDIPQCDWEMYSAYQLFLAQAATPQLPLNKYGVE